MRKVYALGETVFDLLFQGQEPITAKAGGSMLNTAISLGRLNVPIEFISEYGYDKVGNIIDAFLHENNVSTQHVYRYKDRKTALALAFLDDDNNAEYEFYKQYPDQRLQISLPDIQENDIVLFGSFFSITDDVRNILTSCINQAKQNNAIIIYDPNFRRSHLADLPNVKSYILENMMLADIIRGSDEDFEYIFNAQTHDQAYDQISGYCNNLIYTANRKGVHLYSINTYKHISVPDITPKSTVGAGDAFNAGIIYALVYYQIMFRDLTKLSETQWENIIQFGVEFAHDVCMTIDNYISEEFSQKIKTNYS